MSTPVVRLRIERMGVFVGLLPLAEGRVLRVGALPPSDLLLDSPYVSPLHAELKLTARGLEVSDLRSLNGTWFDNRRIKRVVVTSGDRIRIGDHDLRFEDFRSPVPAEQCSEVIIEAPPPTLGAPPRRLSIKPGVHVIGRDPALSEITFNDEFVSARHAELMLDQEGLCITDLGSANGFEVDGEQKSSAWLQDGSRVAFTPATRFVVEMAAAANPRPPRTKLGQIAAAVMISVVALSLTYYLHEVAGREAPPARRLTPALRDSRAALERGNYTESATHLFGAVAHGARLEPNRESFAKMKALVESAERATSWNEAQMRAQEAFAGSFVSEAATREIFYGRMVAMLARGQVDGAIEGIDDILEYHPDAPQPDEREAIQQLANSLARSLFFRASTSAITTQSDSARINTFLETSLSDPHLQVDHVLRKETHERARQLILQRQETALAEARQLYESHATWTNNRELTTARISEWQRQVLERLNDPVPQSLWTEIRLRQEGNLLRAQLAVDAARLTALEQLMKKVDALTLEVREARLVENLAGRISEFRAQLATITQSSPAASMAIVAFRDALARDVEEAAQRDGHRRDIIRLVEQRRYADAINLYNEKLGAGLTDRIIDERVQDARNSLQRREELLAEIRALSDGGATISQSLAEVDSEEALARLITRIRINQQEAASLPKQFIDLHPAGEGEPLLIEAIGIERYAGITRRLDAVIAALEELRRLVIAAEQVPAARFAQAARANRQFLLIAEANRVLLGARLVGPNQTIPLLSTHYAHARDFYWYHFTDMAAARGRHLPELHCLALRLKLIDVHLPMEQRFNEEQLGLLDFGLNAGLQEAAPEITRLRESRTGIEEGRLVDSRVFQFIYSMLPINSTDTRIREEMQLVAEIRTIAGRKNSGSDDLGRVRIIDCAELYLTLPDR